MSVNFQSIIGKDELSSEYANVPRDLNVKTAIETDLNASKQVTIDEVINGNVSMLGNESINTNTIQSALNNDPKAIDLLSSKINTYNRKLLKKPPIANVELAKDFLPTIKAAPANLNDDEKSQFEEYQSNRVKIFNSLTGAKGKDGSALFKDQKVKNLITKYFSSGEFFTETGRQVMEIPRALAELPVLFSMAKEAIGAGFDAIGEDTFEKSWEKRQPKMAFNNVAYTELFKKFVGNRKFSGSVNSDLLEKYLETHGADVHAQAYRPVMADGKALQIPLINDEQGEWLLRYGFQDLPLEEKYAERLLEGVGFTKLFSSIALNKGKNQLKLVKELRTATPKKYPSQISDIEVLRMHRMEKAWKFGGKSWQSFKASVGRKFNNTGAIGAASSNIEYTRAMKASDDAITSKFGEIRELKKQKNYSQLELDNLNGQLQNLQNVNNTLWLKSLGTGNRYTVSTLGQEIPMAAFQATGEHYAEQLGLSPELGGFLGVVSYATSAYKLATFLPTKIVGLGSSFFNLQDIGTSTARLMEDWASLPFDIGTDLINKTLGKELNAIGFKGLFVDRRFDELEKLYGATGKAITTSEKASFKKLAILMKDMSQEQRELAFASIKEYRGIRENLVNSFAEGPARDEAAEVFQLSFAHASGLAPLQALDRLNLAKIDPQNPDLKKLTETQIESENSLSIAQKGISRLLEMMNNPEAGFDIERNASALKMIEGFKKAVDGQQIRILERKQGLLQLTRDYVEKTLLDPLAPIDESTIKKIHDTNLLLNKNLTDNPKLASESLIKTITKVRAALVERSKSIEKYRGTDEYKFRMGQLVEDMYDVHIESNYELGKSFYQEAENIAKGRPPIDLSNIVEKMVAMTDGLEATDLSYFFSSKSRFFNSRAGRLAKKSFDRMGRRALKDAGINDEYLQELQFFFKNTKDPENYIGENPSIIEIALHLNKKGIKMADGSTQKTNLNAFQASPFEVDEMRRFFTNVAEKSNDDALTSEYNKFIKRIDDAIGLDPVLDKAMAGARGKYKTYIFDPNRKGSVGFKINNAREGPERTSQPAGMYRYTYDEDFRPENFHEDVSEAIFDLLENKGTNPGVKVKQKIKDLSYYWGDKGENGEVFFDLTTDNGKAKINNLRELLKMQFHEHWGMVRENLVTQITKKLDSPEYDILTTPITTASNFGNSAKLKKLADEGAFKVQVKTYDDAGNIVNTEMNLLDMEQMISADNDISHVLELSTTARKQHNKLIQDLNNASSDINTEAKVMVNIQETGERIFEKMGHLAEDPAKFFETFIARGSKDRVEILREQYFSLRQVELKSKNLDPESLKKATEEMEIEFKQGMQQFIVKGLLERAGSKQSSTIKLKALDGTVNRNHMELSNAAQFATDLKHPDTREILEMFIEPDHLEFVDNLSAFMEFAAGASQLRFSPSGVIRAISPNELISRAFNLARGMVSPTYVAAELGIRVAAQQGIELMGLALENKKAADIMGRMLDAPETLSLPEIKNFAVLVKSYVARQLLKKNLPSPLSGNFISQSELQNYQYQTSEEIFEQIPEKGTFVNQQLNQLNAL